MSTCERKDILKWVGGIVSLIGIFIVAITSAAMPADTVANKNARESTQTARIWGWVVFALGIVFLGTFFGIDRHCSRQVLNQSQGLQHNV